MKKASNSRLKIRKARIFSEPLKRQIVNELSRGGIRISQMAKLHCVSITAVYKWIYKYSGTHSQTTRQVVEMESESKKTLNLQKENAEMLRILGMKQMQIDYLNKILELASEELGVDIKKKFPIEPLSGLNEIQKNTDIL